MAVFHKRISSLLLKYLRNELTDAEAIELNRWVDEAEENRALFNRLTNDETLQQELKEYYESQHTVFEKIQARIAEESIISIAPKNSWKKYVAAAAVLIILGTSVTWFFVNRTSQTELVATPIPPTQQLSSITPGGNRATLTIDNGPVIFLDSVANGTIAEAGNSRVVKLSNGELEYKAIGNKQQSSFSTLSTQNGDYHLRLQDGTEVWLNAQSSIKYPDIFTGAERVVEITGEAYFEVAHNAAMPFIVKKANSDIAIQVLGTHFDVNAYDNEEAIKVTLLEGSVKTIISNRQSAILKPGQQAAITSDLPAGRQGSRLTIYNNVDTDEAIAWKNGRFQFNSADLSTVLRQAARWYDIEISFANGIPPDKFTGPIPRKINLDQFLEILDMSEVRYQLKEGRKLIVYHK